MPFSEFRKDLGSLSSNENEVALIEVSMSMFSEQKLTLVFAQSKSVFPSDKAAIVHLQ